MTNSYVPATFSLTNVLLVRTCRGNGYLSAEEMYYVYIKITTQHSNTLNIQPLTRDGPEPIIHHRETLFNGASFARLWLYPQKLKAFTQMKPFLSTHFSKLVDGVLKIEIVTKASRHLHLFVRIEVKATSFMERNKMWQINTSGRLLIKSLEPISIFLESIGNKSKSCHLYEDMRLV